MTNPITIQSEDVAPRSNLGTMRTLARKEVEKWIIRHSITAGLSPEYFGGGRILGTNSKFYVRDILKDSRKIIVAVIGQKLVLC